MAITELGDDIVLSALDPEDLKSTARTIMDGLVNFFS